MPTSDNSAQIAAAAEFLAAGRIADALRLCEQALAVSPDDPDALHISSLILSRQGDAEQAIDRLTRAIEQRPESAEMLANLGQIQLERGQYEAAHDCFAASLDLAPDDLFTRLRLALTLDRQLQLREAEAVYRDLIDRAPDYAPAHNDLAVNLQNQGRREEALDAFQTSFRLDPGNLAACAMAARLRQTLGRWEGFDRLRAALIEPALVQAPGIKPPSPLNILSLPVPVTPAEFRAIVGRFASSTGLIAAPRFQFGPPQALGPMRRLRVGYISSDFTNHPVGHIVSGLFRHHDRQAVEVTAYATTPDAGSPERRRIAADVEHFVELSTIDTDSAARRIHADRIDVLVDLNGHTQGNRLEVLAQRPAPVQATWFGFPGTLGVDFVDYLIADDVVVPEAGRAQYSEQIASLPDAYIAVAPKAAALPANRVALGLPERGFVFGMFSAPYKVESIAFAIWMRLLARVPDSVLWIWADNQAAFDSLRRHAAGQGIEAGRLIAAPTVSRPEHLARQRAADILLDTLFYGAHTTAADALAAGVPVVTCTGSLYAARASTTLLRAAGLPELAATTPAEYEAIALKLATDAAALADVRQRLAAAHKTMPLFDPERFVRGFEGVLQRMWELHVAGKPPQPIKVGR
jgi:predicted O-linked N-acetylglucosamine transferase (SPINDLY family)